jgi:WD40 repeat protein
MVRYFEKALQDVNDVYLDLSVAESKGMNNTLYDLHSKVIEFLDSQVEKVCIAFGDSGSGKSIYCNKLAQNLLITKSEYLPIYVYLPLYKSKVDGDMIEAVLMKYRIDLADELRYRKILFILDAYDELNSYPNIIVSNQIMEIFENSKVLFTCRTNEAPPNLNTFASKDALGKPEKYSTLYIQPLSKDSIEHYARKVAELNIGWNSFDELWNIINREEVLQLLSNPFLLGACLKNPAILNNLYAQNTKINMVRTYQEYINVYQTNEYERIDNQQYDLEEMQQIYTQASIDYAFKILEKGNLSRADIFQQELVSRGCLLKESTNKSYNFLHPSIGDYFVALGVIRIAKGWNTTKDINQLNRVELMERYKVLDFIKEMMNEYSQEHKQLIQEVLFSIIRLRDPKLGLASSNAISILNYCGKSFYKQDLSGVFIKKANLRYACLINANLNGSDLENANLTQANLRRAHLKNCNLIGVTLGIQYRDMKHSSRVASVFISSDNRYIVSGSRDAIIKVWHLETGDLKNTLQGHSDCVNSLFISSDNRYIASASSDTNIKVWDLETGSLERTLQGHSRSVTSLYLSSDNRYIASGSEDKSIKLWNFETGSLKRNMIGHSSYVSSVCVSSDDLFIISGGDDMKIKVWELETGNLKYTLQGHSDWVRSVNISGDNRYIISASRDATIKVWELETGNLKQTLQGHSDCVNSLIVSSDNRYIVSGSSDMTIKTWELETGDLKHTLQGHSRPVSSVSVSSDNRYIASGSDDKAIKVWEFEAGDLKHTAQGHSNWVASVYASSDSRYMASAGDDMTIKVWELESGDLKHTLQGHSDLVSCVCVSSNNQYIVSSSDDTTIKVWRLVTGNLIHTLQGHSDLVASVFVSSDSRYIISGSGDTTIKVWDLETGNLIRTLEGHSNWVVSVFVSEDNRYIASASSDMTIKVWVLKTGVLKQTLQGHSSYVNSVFISGDNRYIISGSCDMTVKVWELKPAEATEYYQLVWSTYEGICALDCNFESSKLSRELETTLKYYQANRF